MRAILLAAVFITACGVDVDIEAVDRCVTYAGGAVDVPAGERLRIRKTWRYELPDILVNGEVVVSDATGVRVVDGACPGI